MADTIGKRRIFSELVSLTLRSHGVPNVTAPSSARGGFDAGIKLDESDRGDLVGITGTTVLVSVDSARDLPAAVDRIRSTAGDGVGAVVFSIAGRRADDQVAVVPLDHFARLLRERRRPGA